MLDFVLLELSSAHANALQTLINTGVHSFFMKIRLIWSSNLFNCQLPVQRTSVARSLRSILSSVAGIIHKAVLYKAGAGTTGSKKPFQLTPLSGSYLIGCNVIFASLWAGTHYPNKASSGSWQGPSSVTSWNCSGRKSRSPESNENEAHAHNTCCHGNINYDISSHHLLGSLRSNFGMSQQCNTEIFQDAEPKICEV